MDGRQTDPYVTDTPETTPGAPRAYGRRSTWTTVSWVLAFASILFGLLTAIIGVITGFIGRSQGDPRAGAAIATNAVIGVLSVLIAWLWLV